MMVVYLPGGTVLVQALREEGYALPNECRDVQLLMPVDGVYVLWYEVNVTYEALLRIGRALARVGEDGLKQDRERHENRPTESGMSGE